MASLGSIRLSRTAWLAGAVLAAAALDIEHRLTKPWHPWTNGQSLPRTRSGVKRMNRTIKDATVKRFHYDSHEQLRRHLADVVDAYNFARRLKTLKGLRARLEITEPAA